MWFVKRVFSKNSSKNAPTNALMLDDKLKVGILGTGKIGTDLLVKVMRSNMLECTIFAGRNINSPGMQKAASLNVPVSNRGIDAFTCGNYECDIVFDATTAASHLEHAQIFDRLGIFAIDMTPSQIGECVVPAIEMESIHAHKNVSMISCGGQSSIPVAYMLSVVLPEVTQFKISSTVAADSIGPGTLANINEYYSNTQFGITKYTGVASVDVELIVDDINPPSEMRTSIHAEGDINDVNALLAPLEEMMKRVQKYVPGYKLIRKPVQTETGVRIDISVRGLGDYLPEHAGNLDIINCAAIAVAEEFAKTKSQVLDHREFAYG